MDDDTQLEIRKFLKRLGIGSQQELHKYLSDNPDKKKLSMKVIFQIDEKEAFYFEDKIET
tara:strand:- start:303 stop:482 length:180 start_codon:yes stop_codon:yes gene_type:complete